MGGKDVTTLTERVGRRIKNYRKMRNMSVDALAALIDRSKATIYKYESGQISPDTETIERICGVLKIPPTFLFDTPSTKYGVNSKVPFLNTNRFYTYNYDGRINRTVQSLLVYQANPDGDDFLTSFYMDLDDFSQPERSRYIYSGYMVGHETVSYFIMENLTLPIETITIQMVHPFHTSQITWALFMGLSEQPLAPISMKMLLSKSPLSAGELDSYSLAFTKDEVKEIRDKNALILSVSRQRSV